jgi:lipoprotein-releasing system ATP-binding protein
MTKPVESIPLVPIEVPAQPAAKALMSATALCKSYHKGGVGIPVLRGVDLEIRQREFVAIMGQSGSGKSTLLHLLGTLDNPDMGTIYFEGYRIDNLAPAGRDLLRNKYLGMIFQFYHLLPELTALENVLTPIMIAESWLGYMRNRRAHHRRATELLDMVGLSHRLKHRPSELSGGEMQRTAIARALISQPRLLLADEPTGNLDRSSGDEILSILRRLNREQNLTIVMVTHDQRIADQADRMVTLVDGRVAAA